MIFIVTVCCAFILLGRLTDAMEQTSNGRIAGGLSFHVNRIGHHIRASIFEEAKRSVGNSQDVVPDMYPGVPEPIPERQEDINKQADAAIRDLFPRIPNTDRQMVIQHAFDKVSLPPDQLSTKQ
jgi:hypothetical protein